MKTLIPLVLLILTTTVFAAFDRNLDPVILNGAQLHDFLNQDVNHLKCYSYNQTTSGWTALPIQVDELDGTGSYFGAKNGTLDSDDQVVVMVERFGDPAPDSEWVDDLIARDHPRYEIAVKDSATGDSAYAYIFLSSTLAGSDYEYVSYSPDRVIGETYGISHNPVVASGFPDSLAIAGSDVDFLDRWRFRIKFTRISGTFEGINIEITQDIFLTENTEKNVNIGLGLSVKLKTFQNGEPKVKAGPVRVIRKNLIGLSISNSSLGVQDTANIPIMIHYYRNFTEFEPEVSFTFSNINEIDTEFISFSKAFTTDAIGMTFEGPEFYHPATTETDDIIDSGSNEIYKKELGDAEWPGWHWYGYSGQSGETLNNLSVFNLVQLKNQAIDTGQLPALFYYDIKNDQYEDYSVNGVSGLRIYQWEYPENDLDFHVVSKEYYFTENKTETEFADLFDTYRQGLGVQTSGQTFVDEIRPDPVKDLLVLAIDDTTMELVWTATGDDGDSSGPAYRYVIRYSQIAPADMVGNDWSWWSAATTETFQNPPAPVAPGEIQTLRVGGLSVASQYYFRLNVVDDSGNQSGLSNTATGTTTPVELAYLKASPEDDNSIVLSWQTVSETNNLGFAVERRKNEQSDWQEIGFVRGAGTTNEAQYYTFRDTPGQSGEWYYRLKQTDTNGKVTSTQAVSAELAAPDHFALAQNFPNPFNPSTVIEYSVPANISGQLTLKVYDMLGRTIRTLVNRPEQAGVYRVSWDGRNDNGELASSGVYIYRLSAPGFSKTRKMIKLQ